MADTEDEAMDVAALSLLADALPAVEPPPALRERLLAELAGPQRFAPLAQEISDTFAVPLPAVLAALARIDDDAAWLLPSPSGPHILPVQGRTVISRLAAGTVIPRHRHKARELTYVLDGLLISDGAEHGRASCIDMAPGTEHALVVGDEGDCVVVFAVQQPA